MDIATGVVLAGRARSEFWSGSSVWLEDARPPLRCELVVRVTVDL